VADAPRRANPQTPGHPALPPPRDLWLPGDSPAASYPRYTGTNLLLTPMTQESFIRINYQTVGLNPGTYSLRLYAERGAPRFNLVLAATPAKARLAGPDADALATIFSDCCRTAARGEPGPCTT
jgi:hypothetical protein